MSNESPGAACSRTPVCRSAVTVVLLILLSVTTTGWVVTAMRDRPLYVSVPPAAPSEAPRQPAPLPPVAPAPVEPAAPVMIEVYVAARDLPVGTFFSREELKSLVKLKKLPKDGLPPTYITNAEELLEKRNSRPLRAEETFHPQDLVKGVLTLPEGHDLVSVQVSLSNLPGFIGPGNRVNVIATVRKGNKLHAFPLLVNKLVLAVDTQSFPKDGTFPTVNTVSFAVKEKEALLLSLAKSRGCNIELILRHPNKSSEDDKDYNLDAVIKLLSEEKEQPAIEEAPAPRPVGAK